MAKVKVGINGFGRIGSMLLRATIKYNLNIDIVGINDPFLTPDYAAYMIKYDTIHGRFDASVEAGEDFIVVNGKKIMFYQEREPEMIPWKACGAEIIAEATGKFTNKEDAERHLKAGAKKVVITAPGKGGVPVFVIGVNHTDYRKDMNVVSNASCTTNCLAPLAKCLRRFGLV